MKKLYLALLSSLLLTACGGGSSDDSNVSTHEKHSGEWTTGCTTYQDGTSSVSSLLIGKEDDVDVLVIGTADYSNINCNGAEEFIIVGGSPTYSGETVTSICIADNLNMEIIVATDETETQYTGSNLQSFLFLNGINNEVYDIVCQYNDQLLLGETTDVLDASTSAKRPTAMDVTSPFYPVSTSAARAVNSETTSLDKLMKKTFKTLQSAE